MPFYVRAGKCLPVTTTEVLVTLNRPPRALFGEASAQANYPRFRLSPRDEIALGTRSKRPGEAMVGEAVELVVCQQHADAMDPYERLLSDAAHGDATLFAREDAVEAAWRVVDPVLGTASVIHECEPNTWGPTVIVTDGDVVFQPRKVQRSGIWQVADGHVLIYIHKQHELDDIAQLYPARHYVLIDDKLAILTPVKHAWGARLMTVFPRQGKYPHDPKILAANPPADVTIERIGDLLAYDAATLLAAARPSAGPAGTESLATDVAARRVATPPAQIERSKHP